MGSIIQFYAVFPCLFLFCRLTLSQECGTKMENVDFPGNDITHILSPDVSHCQLACTQHPTCLFFTYLRHDWDKDTRTFYCYLKSTSSGTPPMKPLQGVTSGFSMKGCEHSQDTCEFPLYHNIDFTGGDFLTLFTGDHRECQRACNKQPGCQAFTFLGENFADNSPYRNKCFLKFSWTVPTPPKINRLKGGFSGFAQKLLPVPQTTAVCLTNILNNTDIPGKDFEQVLAVSAKHCLFLCSAHPYCTYFTYNMGNLKCFLKHDTDQMVLSKRTEGTSGFPVRLCTPLNDWVTDKYEGIDFLGSDSKFVLLDDMESCQLACNEDPQCQFYTYISLSYSDPVQRRRCYLKHVMTLPVPAKLQKVDGVVSGFHRRDCHLKGTSSSIEAVV